MSSATIRIVFLAISAALPSVVAADDLATARNQEKAHSTNCGTKYAQRLREAATLAAKDAEAGRELLQSAIVRVRNSSAGTDSQRADLVAVLQSAVRELGRSFSSVRPKEIATPLPVLPGRTLPASGARPGAGDVFNSAAARIKSSAEQLVAQEQLRKNRELATTAQVASIHQTAGQKIPEMIDFPKWFAKLSERGKVKLTPQEAAMLKALETPISVDFRSESLRNSIRSLGDKSGTSLDVAKDVLEAVGVQYDDPVTMKLDRTPMRTILRKVLRDRGMAYVVKDGAIVILTPEQAAQMMTVRAYSIMDFVGPIEGERWPNSERAKEDRKKRANELIRVICTAIDLPSWNFFGGPCSIVYEDTTRSLVVRASAEMHYGFNRGMISR